MKGPGILLISHGPFDKSFLESIRSAVSRQFNLPVDYRDGLLNVADFYDARRRQYNGNKLLLEIESRETPGYIKRIGLFRVDLFIPILTYIFGQASLNGRSGIASLYRLRNEQYGLKKNHALMQDRFRKVVIHELGHTFGLIHCHTPECVMRSSTYVEDIDQKEIDFCLNCRSKLSEIRIESY